MAEEGKVKVGGKEISPDEAKKVQEALKKTLQDQLKKGAASPDAVDFHTHGKV